MGELIDPGAQTIIVEGESGAQYESTVPIEPIENGGACQLESADDRDDSGR